MKKNEKEEDIRVKGKKNQIYDNKAIKAPFKSTTQRVPLVKNVNHPGVGEYDLDNNGWKLKTFNAVYCE